jgi:hypothetical protein
VPDEDILSFYEMNLINAGVKEIKHEKMKYFEKINNGVVKVKVEYNVKHHDSILDFAGLHRINVCQSLIQLCGMPAKCLSCNKFGHIRKECPKCLKCNNHGHKSEECSFANRTSRKAMPLQTDNNQEEIVGDEMVVQPNSSMSENAPWNETDYVAPTTDASGTRSASENPSKLVSGSEQSLSKVAAAYEVEEIHSVAPNDTNSRTPLMSANSKVFRNQNSTTKQMKQEIIDDNNLSEAELERKRKNKIANEKRKEKLRLINY